jgi:hypothetical protein
MELTPEKVQELLEEFLRIAKQTREKIPFSETDGFPAAIIFLGPNLEPASHPISWHTEQEKYRKMKAVSEVARQMFCQAVALISDTRWVQEKDAVRVLGIPSIAEVGLEKYLDNYRRVVKERYAGYLGNAPKELFTDAIIVAMKGPRLDGPKQASASYKEGPQDSIRWLGPITEEKIAHFNLLPDWWC